MLVSNLVGENMKTVIAGSRDINNSDFLIGLENCPFLKHITVVISGTARGADKFGESWAQWKDIPVMRFPAEWDNYGSRAGYLRNELMADVADAVIIIWDGVSNGSRHMRDIAVKRDLLTYLYNLNTKHWELYNDQQITYFRPHRY